MDLIEFETAPEPRASVIVLHGLGADGHDMQPICEALELAPPGGVRFVLPHAEERAVTINGGWRMRAWYDILAPDGAGGEDETGLRGSIVAVLSLIEREMARGIPSERVVLMGFSQGCAMSLLAGLRCPHRLAALVGLSGYLPLAATTAAERQAVNRAVPVFLAHGSDDPVVSIARGRASRDVLLALGQPLDWHEYPIDHSVSLEELRDLQAWLRKILG